MCMFFFACWLIVNQCFSAFRMWHCRCILALFSYGIVIQSTNFVCYKLFDILELLNMFYHIFFFLFLVGIVFTAMWCCSRCGRRRHSCYCWLLCVCCYCYYSVDSIAIRTWNYLMTYTCTNEQCSWFCELN